MIVHMMKGLLALFLAYFSVIFIQFGSKIEEFLNKCLWFSRYFVMFLFQVM